MGSFLDLYDKKRFLVIYEVGTEGPKAFLSLSEKQESFKNCQIIAGYKDENYFFKQNLCETDIRMFWIGNLLNSLLLLDAENHEFYNITKKFLGEENTSKLYTNGFLNDSIDWISFVRENRESCLSVLDGIDELLEKADRQIVVVYDAIDKIDAGKADLTSFLRPLLFFWMRQNRCWSQIRCKIFLREDLYQPQMTNFQDGSKIFSYIIRL